jgi:hypothetical protein
MPDEPERTGAPPPGGSAQLETINDGAALAQWLADSEHEGQAVRTYLKASDRVIARVTDGIYREPASALRELISNAWDADANLVTIHTDAPRFSRITIRDDGSGMDYETLSRLVHNIGGSAKRTEEGQALGVTAKDDPERTPGGRLLIGKIGIGLFSVSQLARRFRIVTKVRNERYRLIADVRLRTYSEDTSEDVTKDADDSYVAGEVVIALQHAEDVDAHGTDVIIEDVKPRVRDLLRSGDRWKELERKATAKAEGTIDDWVDMAVQEPRFHAGWIRELSTDFSKPAVLTVTPNLPWTPDTPADTRMALLMEAVEGEYSRLGRPELRDVLDLYLQTLWTLALSSPVPYVDSHPFDLTGSTGIELFWVANEPRGQAVHVPLAPEQTVREAVKQHVFGSPVLEDGLPTQAGEFRVMVDGVELRRPIRFRFRRDSLRGLDHPLMFVGQYSPDLGRVDASIRGGDLALEGYLFWTPRIIPKENNGVMVRIRGASGALFDPTFFHYQVSEQTRLRQITSEMFARRGLDAALNIDRESFNFSHPHVQLVTNWLHSALRQLTNKHKDLSGRSRADRQREEAALFRTTIEHYSANIWRSRHGNEPLPEVTIVEDSSRAEAARRDGFIALTRSEMPSLTSAPSATLKERDARAQALGQVLAAYGVLADRPYAEQQALVDAILSIFYGVSE